MKTNRINNSVGQEYLVMFRVYVCPNGSMVVVFGNQRLEVTSDEVHALLLGTLAYSDVFKSLHQQIDVTALTILNGNSK